MLRRVALLVLPVLTACSLRGPAPVVDPPADPTLLESFDYAWARVAEVHPDAAMRGLDWDAVRARHRPAAEAARTVAEVRTAIGSMLGELGESHYAVFPGVQSAAPATSSSATSESPSRSGAGGGSVGLELRLIDGAAVVTRVLAGGPAEEAGVRLG